MFCNKCGAQVMDGANACSNCGNIFSAPQAVPPQPAPQAVPPQQQFQQVPQQQFQQVPQQQFQQAPQQQFQQAPQQQFQQMPQQQFQQMPQQQFQQMPQQQFQQMPQQQFQQMPQQQFQQMPQQQGFVQPGYAQPGFAPMYPPKPPVDVLKVLGDFFGRSNKTSALFETIIAGVLLIALILWMIYPGGGNMNGFSAFADYFQMRNGGMIFAGILHIFSFLAIAGTITLLFLKKMEKRDSFFKISALTYAICELLIFIIVIAASSGNVVPGGDLVGAIFGGGVFALAIMIEKKETPNTPYGIPTQQNSLM